MKANGVLGHLCILVARRQVTQSADGGLGDVLSVPRAKHRSHQRFDAPDLPNEEIGVKKTGCNHCIFQAGV